MRTLVALGLGLLVGCAAPVADTPSADALTDSDAGTTEPGSADGAAVLYFHGMSHLGFSPAQVKSAVGDWAVLAPSLSDSAIQGAVAGSTKSFVAAHDTVVSGYSLGRIPVFRLMQANAPGMRRVVMIDPTYDSASDLGRGIGGPITKTWLAGDSSRTFLLVYGDSTVQLDGDDSYRAALAENPQAELCYVPGAHARFRAADLAAALVATSCEDLVARLAR